MKKLILILVSVLMIACSEQQPSVVKKQQQQTVRQQTLNKTLYFSGVIEPISQTPVIVSDSSVIEKVYAHYGDVVKKDQALVQLNSATLHKELNEALTNYLKAKDSYNVAKAKFQGTQQLWDAGLIPKNNYLSEKSSVDTNLISLLQQEEKLKQTANRIQGVNLDKFAKLQLKDMQKIKEILQNNYNIYTIKAQKAGVLLMPPKSSGDEGSGEIRAGAHIKENQVIAMIGDMHGVAVNIKISEIDVKKIKPGQKAQVSGPAFPNQSMFGVVKSVGAQASTANASSGFPVFEASVIVDKLTKAQQQSVKVGMSAQVEVAIESKQALMIPIKAVFEANGKSMVNVKNNGVTKPQQITTGETSINEVVVLSGLKQGDVIVFNQA